MLKFFLVFIFCVLYRLKLCPSVRYSGKNKSFVLEMKKQLRETKKEEESVPKFPGLTRILSKHSATRKATEGAK